MRAAVVVWLACTTALCVVIAGPAPGLARWTYERVMRSALYPTPPDALPRSAFPPFAPGPRLAPWRRAVPRSLSA